MAPVTPDATALLREHGLRVTAARVAVLSAIAHQPHAPADEIASAARDHLGALSSAAVYEVLNTFTEVGLVRRIEPAGSPARYETRTADNHHHAVCRQCGAISDIDCAVGHAPCLEPSNANGFLIEQAEVTWWGICANCNGSASSNDSTSS
jgi:Fur family transcriptional regulator, stress-responsive regulator